jgi:hypothetical protein
MSQMGNSAVAVLHYDLHDEIKKISPRLAAAMRDFPGADGPIDFGLGRVISWDHADGYQVVVVHGNTGWRLYSQAAVPDDVEQSVANALKLRGWKCTPPKKGVPNG